MERRIISKQTLADYNAGERDNLILIDKPPGWTSFDVVKKIRNIGRFKKVGHAGTLDPFATGLLILGTEGYTRQLQAFSDSDKVYEGVIAFGEERDTGDVTGRTIRTGEFDAIDLDLVSAKAAGLTGESQQTPPMHSAKKVAGQRLYKLARKGVVVDRKPQRIVIHTFRITGSTAKTIDFHVACSKGTYIRSLAHDLGRMTGYGAYLKELRRVAIGGFSVGDALAIDEFQHFWRALN